MALSTGLLFWALGFALVTGEYDYGSSEEQWVDSNDEGTIWAVLIAGSNGWYNYRHQADIAHSYHVLKAHGVAADHIITLMYDDVANNPYPGKLFNSPDKIDVYEGVKIDYKGEDVTPANFIAVLQGDKAAVKGGNGRVLESNEKDKVFVYFSDHGAVGLISFPDDILSVKQLTDALKKMHARKKYKELTFYLEACESGSMFENLDPSLNIYAITAANAHESSWGCYCEVEEDLPCLGDLFSVNWMQDSDKENLESETLDQQYKIVKKLTTKSHVQHFGDMGIAKEHVGEFQGDQQSFKRFTKNTSFAADSTLWPVRDIPLIMLRGKWERENDAVTKQELEYRLKHMQKKRDHLERHITKLVKSMVHDKVNRNRVLTTYPARLTKLECHNDVVHAFHRVCFNFNENPYAMKYAYVLANICEMGIETELIVQHLMDFCLDIDVSGVH
ncbi:Protein T28H10.3 [Aphelenchoides avenae]|nr:Protein T28H10.3 [Aphelenchus avenae]